jgi:ubiquinone/menaquinone biosynthesis C-methylase UbiE
MFTPIFPVASRLAAALPLRQPEEAGLQVLDVGAGSAPWSSAFALHYPTARVTALDLPAVVAQGSQHTASLGLAERFTWLEADIETFDFTSQEYDLICCGHIFRFISDERTKNLLAKLVRSLRPGGTLLIADIFLNDDHNGPSSAITIDLSMLVNTAQGRIRTPGEISAWLSEFGLEDIERLQLAGPFPVVVARKGERL